eukprot:TRINITY_DN6450_c0_g1_i1.p1 TRINITY_DN6450_c0_g1~~TRINITY_DN6450_c0_g1_i1.p1  ORF type:complete len:151 (-),score=28.05 TRINITY_DN6450_c0_g1_i1:283-735(-)
MAAIHEGFHQQHAAAAGGVDQARGGSGAGGHRLFAEHVLAGGDCDQRLRFMQRVRCRDVDDGDVRIGQQRCQVGRRSRQAAAFGERGGLFGCGPGDVDHPAAIGSLQRQTEIGGDRAAAEDAEVQHWIRYDQPSVPWPDARWRGRRPPSS